MLLLRALLSLVYLSVTSQVSAQTVAAPAAQSRDSLSAMVTVVGTTVTPALSGLARSELLATQPMLLLRGGLGSGVVRYAAIANFERWTMPDGEAVAGSWGEGFMDRRHPHTVVHEAMLTVALPVRGVEVSVAGGKGFIPFGTDDPMMRPFVKYPANHHLAQVMERIQVVAAVRVGRRVSLEGALFNGDEPLSATSAPQWNRFADSRAIRLSAWPTSKLELQVSHARLRSPEFVRAEGLDHAKRSASARLAQRHGPLRYLLAEWARTTESDRGRALFSYGTALVEATVQRAAWSVALRGEQTSRPEEERLLDPFRTARPPNHLTIQGITRWHIATMQVMRALPAVRALHASGFAEVSRAVSSPRLRPILLDPRNISGPDRAWHLSLGVRAGIGGMPSRIGRYGAAVPTVVMGVPGVPGHH